MKPYNHTVELHNLDAPRQIVPLLINLFNPKSVIDIGCGLGTFLRVFKENGIKDILGIDGSWCKKDLLFNNILPSEFIEQDLEKEIRIDSKFDIALCLEVAEHLEPSRAKSFVSELSGLSDIIIFSAAVPKQGGDHHLNEQWPNYWIELFDKNKFQVFDIFKHYFWDNDIVDWWYSQNMLLFLKKEKISFFTKELTQNHLQKVIHPKLFFNYADYRAEHSVKRHIILLIKAILYKLNLID